MKLLIFPLDSETSTEQFLLVDRVGVDVIAASSVRTGRFLGQEIRYLPFLTDHDFMSQLKELIIAENITHFYSSHEGVWGVLNSYLEGQGELLPVKLVSDFPFDVTWRKFHNFSDWGVSFYERYSEDQEPQLTPDQLTALCIQYTQIPGQSDIIKLESLIHLVNLIPQGDWVEIGSLYGKSSFALGWLANHLKDSPLVCIDPWDTQRIKPQKGKAKSLDRQIDLVDSAKIFQIFKSSIALLPKTSFIQGLSEEGVSRFIESDLDGPILNLSRQIAFLHIDGNHHFDEVTKDIALWEPLICVGGWIAIDDYLWAFGDGPKKAGDNLLHTGRFDIAYVAGDTLYMRKAA